MHKSFNFDRTFQQFSSIFVLILVAAIVDHLFGRLIMARMDFYNNLWGPVSLLVHGRSPYDTESLHPVLPALWFPMGLGFFFPFGWLSEEFASRVWFVFNIIEICVVVYIAQGKYLSLYNTVACALLCFFFPFVLNHYNLGQFAITITLSLMLAAYFLEKKRSWLAAGFLALALTKPQLGMIAIFGLSVFYFQRNRFWGVISFGLKTFLASLLMCLPLFMAFPAWIYDWITSMQQNNIWLQPSLFSILIQSLGNWGAVIWMTIVILILGVSYQVWINCSPLVAMMWSLGLTTIATPYLWSWDFVLLLPIWVYIFSTVDWKRKAFLLILYSIGWYGMALVQVRESSDNHLFWWVPPLLLTGMVLVSTRKQVE
jgi:hypothetical protein